MGRRASIVHFGGAYDGVSKERLRCRGRADIEWYLTAASLYERMNVSGCAGL